MIDQLLDLIVLFSLFLDIKGDTDFFSSEDNFTESGCRRDTDNIFANKKYSIN